MRFAVVVTVVALWFVEARADRAINTLIGDASWAGHTEPGDEVARVRAHLAFVHALLVDRDVSALSPSRREARAASLADLERYIERGVFPRRTDDGFAGRRPRFIDDRGVHCAVGQLITDSGEEELAQAINARFEYAHVRDMTAPALVAWADSHGFTVDELAMIQPGYSPLPTASSVREAILEAKDAIALRCARKYAPMKSLLVFIVGDEHGSARVSTKSSDPFAQCFVRAASGVQRGGGAYIGRPKSFFTGLDLSFTSPQKLLEKKLADWYPSGCSPRPGAIAREATVEITSTREAMTVRGTSSPANALVDDCLVQEAKRHFAEHGAGEWKLHAKRRIVIPTRVVLDPDSLRSYAMNHATDCLPTPEKGATSTITVTANPEDRQFTIVATGSPEFAACMSDALNKSLSSAYRANYNDGTKWIDYFRIDARVNTSVTIVLESQADRLKRNEDDMRRMEMERDRMGF